MERSDYEAYDYLIGMDQRNIKNIMHIIKSDPKHKVYRLLDFTDCVGDIEDPWYTQKFELTYLKIKQGCEALLREIETTRR